MVGKHTQISSIFFNPVSHCIANCFSKSLLLSLHCLINGKKILGLIVPHICYFLSTINQHVVMVSPIAVIVGIACLFVVSKIMCKGPHGILFKWLPLQFLHTCHYSLHNGVHLFGWPLLILNVIKSSGNIYSTKLTIFYFLFAKK